MASILTLTINSEPPLTQVIDYTGSDELIHSFVYTRTKSKDVTINSNKAKQTRNLHDSFNLDYNRKALIKSSYNATTITLEHPTNGFFDGFTIDDASIIGAVETTEQRSTLSISNVYSEADTSPCEFVKSTLTFSENLTSLAVKGILNGEETVLYFNASFNEDEYIINIDRTYTQLRVIAVVVINAEQSTSVNQTFEVPTTLDLNVNINLDTLGGTATIIATELSGNQYAIAASETIGGAPIYVNTNIFTSLAPDNYYAYVKDVYGCVKSKAFEITEAAVDPTNYNVPLRAYHPAKNSIPVWSRPINYETTVAGVQNFLSHEMPEQSKDNNFLMPYGVHQRAQNQFSSSYPRNVVKIYDATNCEGSLGSAPITIEPTQLTDNINRNKYLEGSLSSSDQGYIAVSFSSGNEVDEGGNIIEPHGYNDTLPLYYQEGIQLIINGQATVITSIVEVESVFYAVTNLVYIVDEDVVIESIHIEANFEQFRYFLDFSTIGYNRFYLSIEHYDAFDNLKEVFTSEVVDIISQSDLLNSNYHELKYWSYESDSDFLITTSTLGTASGENGITTIDGFLRNIPFHRTLRRVSGAEIQTEGLGNTHRKVDYKGKEVWSTDFKELPSTYAGTYLSVFDTSDVFQLDNALYTSESACGISHNAHFAVVEPELISINNGVESNFTSDNITPNFVLNTN